MLQAKIQQLVLDQALMERDQGVPPRYKSLVEDYYRVLSQDLAETHRAGPQSREAAWTLIVFGLLSRF